MSILVALSCPGPLDARRTPADTASQEVAPSGGRRQTAGQQLEEVAPAMTRRERKHALPFLLLGVGLFVAGVALGFVMLRFPLDWLLHFGDQQFTLLLKADSYLTFVTCFLLAFGLVFELPLVLTFLGVVGIVSSRTLRARRVYILSGLRVLSAVATPGADPYSPAIVGLALTALFELTFLLLRLLGR